MFLDISKDIEESINEGKIAKDSRWDGLKCYVTNKSLPVSEVIARDAWYLSRVRMQNDSPRQDSSHSRTRRPHESCKGQSLCRIGTIRLSQNGWACV